MGGEREGTERGVEKKEKEGRVWVREERRGRRWMGTPCVSLHFP